MRRNLFLHFLNRDTREIFKLDRLAPAEQNRRLTQALNAAAILCEDSIFSPPGFILEDNLLFRLAEQARPYLKSSLWKLPLREHSLSDYAEKKRTDYGKIRDRYSGLFDDSRLGYLSNNASGLISRETEITRGIISNFREGPDSGNLVWDKVKRSFSATEVKLASELPFYAVDRGLAATWSAMQPLLNADPKIAAEVLRPTLQHTYFQLYCVEYDLIVLNGVSAVLSNFWLPEESNVYCFSRFRFFLDALNLSERLLDAPADLIIGLRQRNPFTDFVDTYVQLACISSSNHDLQYMVRRILEHKNLIMPMVIPPSAIGFQAITPMEIDILTSQMSTLVDGAIELYGTSRRRHNLESEHQQIMEPVVKITTPKLVLFVALREELEVLKNMMGLTALATGSIAAQGILHDREIDVICPKDMGRVPAAAHVTRYLSEQDAPEKTTIIVLGLAGGFEKNGVSEGMVLCADQICDYANRKVSEEEGETTTKLRPRHFTIKKSLREHIDSDVFDTDAWGLKVKNTDGWAKGLFPSISFGPVASGEEVVASDELAAALLSDNTKLLGVEMEAGGVCYAAEMFEAGVFVLRAVSDKADPVKADNEWRRLGMRALGALLMQPDMAKWVRDA